MLQSKRKFFSFVLGMSKTQEKEKLMWTKIDAYRLSAAQMIKS